MKIPDYEITERLYESEHTLIYRGYRKRDKQSVILKFLKKEYPTAEELARFRGEYEITSHLRFEGIVKIHSLEKVENTLVLVEEDFGAQSLKDFLASTHLELEDALSLAIRVTEILEFIHQQNLIHKDINPANIVWNSTTDQIKIIDFGISTRLSREMLAVRNPSALEGTLAYMSPEQTGRMNRAVDYRTDLYSLGVTLYELLAGQLPFQTKDPLELVHSHLAQKPLPPHEVNPDIPLPLSEIVLKLLAKMAEERYQNALGLKVDLQNCLDQFRATGTIFPFELGQQVISDKFQIPQKLYGREEEMEILMNTFAQVSQGQTRMMLVAGYSGIGKSALVREIHKPIVVRRGYFISGKFDQFQKNVSYSAITQAFNELCRYLLMESSEILAKWRAKILEAVGRNGQIVIEVIPDLELVIGRQPPVAEVGPEETQNRFNLFFLSFVKALCNKEHPLVLFIDDLQWVDTASLNLLKNIIEDNELRYLLIIGTYRSNEVDPSHPLIMTVDDLKNSGRTLETIELDNLQSDDIHLMLQEALLCGKAQSQALADLVFRKTQGNPFFTRQFLQTLYEDKLLRFDFEKSQWEWDIEQIKSQNITENVIELMAERMDRLPRPVRETLQWAACIGNRFQLSVLATVCGKNKKDTLGLLWPAMMEELLLPLDENYQFPESDKTSYFRFAHDQIQQAAYAQISDDQKQATHLKIGRLLLAHTPAIELEENLFAIVSQLNEGLACMDDPEEKQQLASLNLRVGKKVKNAIAYPTAVKHFRISMQLLSENAWEQHYAMIFELHQMCGECEYLSGDPEEAERLLSMAFRQAKTNLEKAKICDKQVQHYMGQSQNYEAILKGIEAVRLCGVDFPDSKEKMLTAIETGFAQLEQAFESQNVMNLLHAKEMTDPVKRQAISLLPNMMFSGYLTGNFNVFMLSILKGMEIILKHGKIDISAYLLSCYGLLLTTQGKYSEGYQIARLALALMDQYPQGREKANALNFIGVFLLFYKEPIQNSIEVHQRGVQAGFENGEFMFECANFFNILVFLFAKGEGLTNVLNYAEKTMHLSDRKLNFNTSDVAFGYKQAVTLLQNRDIEYTLEQESFSKEQWQRISTSNSISFIQHLRFQKEFWYDNYSQALEVAKQAEPTLAMVPSYIMCVEHYFLHALVLTRLYPAASDEEQTLYLQDIEANRDKMKLYADLCPENFSHKFLLVQAELSRIHGESLEETMTLYDQAIESARQNNFLQYEALANELAARYWAGLNKENFASFYMKSAHQKYQLWGATVKVAHLEKSVPQLLSSFSEKHVSYGMEQETSTSTSSFSKSGSIVLDLNAVMKASQAISENIVLADLLKKLMNIVIENAGAQKGFFLLEKGDEFTIEAEYCTDGGATHTALTLVPMSIIHYVARTKEAVVLDEASTDERFITDSYIINNQPKSVLCHPVLHHGQLMGILYLENNLVTGAFTVERLEVLKILSSQTAISLENATLYATLEEKVVRRTRQLEEVNTKMVEIAHQAGMAEVASNILHNMGNALNSVNIPANLMQEELNQSHIASLTKAADLLQKHQHNLSAFLSSDERGKNFPEYLEQLSLLLVEEKQSLQNHLTRLLQNLAYINEIVRLQQSYTGGTTLEESLSLSMLVEDAIQMQQESLRQHEIRITRHFEDVPPVQISKHKTILILTNLLSNAKDALIAGHVRDKEIQIRIEKTKNHRVQIHVCDNGIGMDTETLERLFRHGFTTKKTGHGFGLHSSANAAQQMSASLTAQSDGIGHGATFILEIPYQL